MSFPYANQPPAPGGFPGQTPYGGQPGGMPNGIPPPGMRPPGPPPPGHVPYGKPGPPTSMQNGAQGDMYPASNAPVMPPNNTPVSNGTAGPPLAHQMGAMNLSGPPKPGFPPSSVAGPPPRPTGPPTNMHGAPSNVPPRPPMQPPSGPPGGSFHTSQPGPNVGGTIPMMTGASNMPPSGPINSNIRPGAPPTMGPPSSSVGGVMPPYHPPTSAPLSQPGMIPSHPPSLPQPGMMPPPVPTSNTAPHYNAGPPTSMQPGQLPVSATPNMFGQYSQPPSTNSFGAMPGPGGALPPPPGPGGAMPPSTGAGAMLNAGPGSMSMHGQRSMPPSGPGGVPPPLGPGGMPPSGPGNMPLPPGPGGMPPPPGPGGMPPPPGPGGMPPPPGPGGMSHPSGPPPSPGGQYGGYGAPRAPTPQGPMSQPGPKKLDPDQMPSPIQVIEDDRRTHTGEHFTGERGGVPPLVTTEFTVVDQGNASPRFLRSTMYNVPVSGDMLKTAHMPFAITLSPFAQLKEGEQAPPVVDLGQLGPIRCNRCKAYMCPFMLFIDGGRRFQCAFCNCASDVPPEYFQHLDHTGRRVDVFQRPELCLGTYEFVATADYCKDSKLPKPPAFIFMIDVSYNSVKSGLVHLICDRLKNDILVNLPKESGATESEIRVGFVTYHRELHFYNVKGSLAQPQMMVVSDTDDVFVPLLDGFLVTLAESEAVIDSLLSQIPTMFSEARETEIVLGPVIQAGLDALVSAERTGKLFVFHSSLPVAEAPGKLKNRDDRKLLGTDKEKNILTPQSQFYTKLGKDCVAAGCSVDLFLFPNSYMDIATIAEVPRLTGGSIYKYQYFQADIDGERMMEDLRMNVSRPIAFDSILRLRTSTGIRPVDFFGNFHMSNTTDVEFAAMDSDKAITIEIKHDDKLNEQEGAYLQCAVLYTSVSGQRRLRIINTSFNVCSKMADLFRNCELDTLINYLAKNSLRMTLNGSPKQVRESLMNSCAQILACYRQQCASPSSAGQLILPECMKLLPVYVNCIIKSNMLQGGGDLATDERSTLMFLGNAMPVSRSQAFFYPRLMPMHTPLDGDELPSAIRCSYERLEDRGVYLIENGVGMMLWIGLNVNPDWIQQVFSVHSAAQIDIDMVNLQDLDNDLSRQVRRVVKTVREQRQKHLKLIIVRQRDKLEPLFLQYLVEDRSVNGTASYVDFLCHIHKEIRSLLS